MKVKEKFVVVNRLNKNSKEPIWLGVDTISYDTVLSAVSDNRDHLDDYVEVCEISLKYLGKYKIESRHALKKYKK